jgi:predicted DNA-binding protein YlxM (UPF0122 family)
MKNGGISIKLFEGKTIVSEKARELVNAYIAENDLSLEEISVKYNLPLAAVYAAIAYYHDHRTVIDDSIENDKSF